MAKHWHEAMMNKDWRGPGALPNTSGTTYTEHCKCGAQRVWRRDKNYPWSDGWTIGRWRKP